MFDEDAVRSSVDGHTELFGWVQHPGGSNGLVTLYREDDEQWFPSMTFDIHWVKDFLSMATLLASVVTVKKGGACRNRRIRTGRESRDGDE